jgi:hypothetical protein
MGNMFKLTVDQILASMEALDDEEKKELVARLPAFLEGLETSTPLKSGQVMTNTVGNVDMKGNNAAFNYQPMQVGRDNQVSATFNQGSSGQQDLLNALATLQTAIQNTPDLPELSKIGAAAQTEQLAAEAQKETPDKNLIQRTISALKQGLQGITDLAGPVATVSSLVAKAWGIPV